MKELLDLLIKNFTPLLTDLWNNITFWRGGFLIFFILIVAGYKFREKIFQFYQKPVRVELDRNIFKRIDEILPEHFLNSFLDQLLVDHSYFIDDAHRFQQLDAFYREIGNHYNNPELHRRMTIFLTNLRELNTFLALQFFVFPSQQKADNVRLCMHPELNIDRAGFDVETGIEKYEELTTQLHYHVNQVSEKYSDYREFVKNKLFL
jgi:hypothetical protein